MKTTPYLLAAFALMLLVVTVGCEPVRQHGAPIDRVSIDRSSYPADNYFEYHQTSSPQQIVTIVTDEVDLCITALGKVREDYPTAALPAKGASGNLVLYDVDGGLANQCYYIV